jgi:hypothetical protein
MSIGKKSFLKMEYIPDGLTKAQWEAIKKKVLYESLDDKY